MLRWLVGFGVSLRWAIYCLVGMWLEAAFLRGNKHIWWLEYGRVGCQLGMNCRVLMCGRCGLQFCVVIGVRYFYAVEIPVLCGCRRIFGREPRVLMCVLCSVCF